MDNHNRTAQVILILLVLMYFAGFLIFKPWTTYLAGSIIMYLMGSLALNKLKLEIKELQGDEPIGEKAKDQWGK